MPSPQMLRLIRGAMGSSTKASGSGSRAASDLDAIPAGDKAVGLPEDDIFTRLRLEAVPLVDRILDMLGGAASKIRDAVENDDDEEDLTTAFAAFQNVGRLALVSNAAQLLCDQPLKARGLEAMEIVVCALEGCAAARSDGSRTTEMHYSYEMNFCWELARSRLLGLDQKEAMDAFARRLVPALRPIICDVISCDACAWNALSILGILAQTCNETTIMILDDLKDIFFSKPKVLGCDDDDGSSEEGDKYILHLLLKAVLDRFRAVSDWPNGRDDDGGGNPYYHLLRDGSGMSSPFRKSFSAVYGMICALVVHIGWDFPGALAKSDDLNELVKTNSRMGAFQEAL